MKQVIYITILLLIFFFSHALRAEDTIKVLLLEGTDSPVPSARTEKIGHIKGKVFVNGKLYNGSIDVKRDRNGFYFINELPLERYIEGVVASEVGKKWAMEALKAQAVISRTYAVYLKTQNAEKDYHLLSNVLDQVYKGDNINPMISHAVKETGGEILTYKGRPIKAFYHSTTVGKTELPEEVWGETYPYFKSSVVCTDKSSPYQNWQRRFNFGEIEKALGLKNIGDISIASFTSTGRVKTLEVLMEGPATTDANAVREIKATDLRKLLGYKELPSTRFTITIEGREIIFEGKGYGHGVGLCQWGALEMAKKGKNYKEILKYYYPDATLKNRDEQ